jgi:alanine racemase
MSRPLSATIDLNALRHNLAVVRRHAPHSQVLAVVKANAYGHGLGRVARALGDADGYALLEIEAAVQLREAGCDRRIVLLEGVFDTRELAVAVARGLEPVVHHDAQVRMLAALAGGAGIDVMLKLNTGMNRLGFQPREFPGALAALEQAPGVRNITLMTHFASADEPRGVSWQKAVFDETAGGLSLPRSMANSAAVLRFPETHADRVRPGIMLYGCSPFPESVGAELGLAPVMTLASEIIAVRDLDRGDTVGYGGAFTADRKIRIGVVACGYADGYPRHAPSGTPVLVSGQLTRTVGRVSMDMLCVDLSDVPQVGLGARVELWGAGNPVESVAAAAGTVSYELLCALAPRVPVREV